MSKITKHTFTYKSCPFRHAWVNQGLASCDKGKHPLKDCNDCEYNKEYEAEVSYISTDIPEGHEEN